MSTKGKFVGVLLAAAAFLLWVVLPVASEHWSVGIAAERQIPLYLGENLGPAILSPDGSRLLVGRRQKAVPGWVEAAFSFQNYDSKTMALLSTASMPNLPVATPEFGDPPSANPATLTYCDHGKYVLALLGGETFGVLDGDTLQLRSRIAFPADKQHPYKSAILSGSCAANASYAAFELAGPQRLGVTRVFDLSDGSHIAEIPEDLSRGRLMNLAMSPSGTAAAVLVGNKVHPDSPPPAGFDLLILDLQTQRVERWIQTGMAAKQAVFVGDSAVAVVSDYRALDADRSKVRLFDIQTGKMVREFGARGMVTGPPIAASADGTRLLSYTGEESNNEHGRQIKIARFTVWDTGTGRIVAQSAALPILKTAVSSYMFGGLMPWSPTQSWSPEIQLNQAGNAAIVTQESEPIRFFSFK